MTAIEVELKQFTIVEKKKRGRPLGNSLADKKKAEELELRRLKNKERKQRYHDKLMKELESDPLKKQEWEKRQKERRRQYEENRKRREKWKGAQAPNQESESMTSMKLTLIL
jgi:hypothetical protein